MRRRRVVVRSRGPISRRRDELEPSGRRSRRRRKVVRRLLEHGAIEPDHMVVVDRELGVITIVGRSRVWLQMPMRRRPWMVGISLV